MNQASIEALGSIGSAEATGALVSAARAADQGVPPAVTVGEDPQGGVVHEDVVALAEMNERSADPGAGDPGLADRERGALDELVERELGLERGVGEQGK